MPASVVRTVFDTSGNVLMIVHADTDQQLADPAFNPKGTVPVDIPRASYWAAKSHRDVLAAAEPIAAAKSPQAGLAIGAKIKAIDDAAAAALQASIDAAAENAVAAVLP